MCSERQGGRMSAEYIRITLKYDIYRILRRTLQTDHCTVSHWEKHVRPIKQTK